MLSRGWAVLVAAATMVLAAPAAWAQRQPGSDAAGAAVDPAERLRRELSTSGSGQLQTPRPVEQLGSSIAPSRPLESEERPVVSPVAADTSGQPAPVRAASEPRLSGLAGRVAGLVACRAEIAQSRGVSARRVRAGTLQLRWAVLADGVVTRPEVVALGSTDPEVLACIKQKMSQWRFLPAPTAPVLELVHELRF